MMCQIFEDRPRGGGKVCAIYLLLFWYRTYGRKTTRRGERIGVRTIFCTHPAIYIYSAKGMKQGDMHAHIIDRPITNQSINPSINQSIRKRRRRWKNHENHTNHHHHLVGIISWYISYRLMVLVVSILFGVEVLTKWIVTFENLFPGVGIYMCVLSSNLCVVYVCTYVVRTCTTACDTSPHALSRNRAGKLKVRVSELALVRSLGWNCWLTTWYMLRTTLLLKRYPMILPWYNTYNCCCR